ncbi:hypothetical protein BJ165DRAFT_1332693, partial [Panaeolus papilionaceus]
RAPLTQSQQQAKKKVNDQTCDNINEAVDAWFQDTKAKANKLAECFNKRPWYFLDIFFGGSTRMVSHQTKTNAHNAYLHFKSEENRDEGVAMLAVALQKEYQDEYNNLTAEEREEIVREYDDKKSSALNIRQLTPQSRIADVSNTVCNMCQLMEGLQRHVGSEGFFCLVRNNAEYSMEPQWYFSCKALESYMPLAVARRTWDTARVGTKIEAFAVAGCD